MVEVNLHDLVLMLVDDALSTGDLLGWVEDVIVAEANLGSYQARLTIVSVEAKCPEIIPNILCDGQVS